MFYAWAVRIEYRLEPCRTAPNRVKGMPFAWSLNPYMGCVSDEGALDDVCAVQLVGATTDRDDATLLTENGAVLEEAVGEDDGASEEEPAHTSIESQ